MLCSKNCLQDGNCGGRNMVLATRCSELIFVNHGIQTIPLVARFFLGAIRIAVRFYKNNKFCADLIQKNVL